MANTIFMPRPTRIEYENAFYHVMNRGRGRQAIYHSDDYYYAFLETLKESHERFDAIIHAYCLMGNHYHLIIETPRANLGRIMRHINGIYTQRYNRLKKTDGPLFRGRYKAILVDEDAYLLQLSRYVHRNPVEVKGRIKTVLENYPWSSYLAYIGKATVLHWLNRDKIYQMAGHRHCYAGYRAYVEAGIDEDIKRYYGKGNIAAVLGDKSFRESVYEADKNVDKTRLQQALCYRPDSQTIVRVVAGVFNMAETQLTQTSKNKRVRNDARKIAMYCCQQIGDIPLRKIASDFSLNHVGSVSRMIHDIKIKLTQGEYSSQLQKIENQLLVIQ